MEEIWQFIEEIWQFIKDNAAAVGAAAAAVAVLITLVTVFFRGVTTVGASFSKHLKGKKEKAGEAARAVGRKRQLTL